ncbi:hypothetical protein E2C01_054260 [Portunus trituberculatus]|uniref:Uncharacterized protein n=1 Tax=Portunus trituberculatus TaxID=210409 RepID=A0A5B7GJE9_PORTR|nr:hypothetical protein [Portunus trituberculatus]
MTAVHTSQLASRYSGHSLCITTPIIHLPACHVLAHLSPHLPYTCCLKGRGEREGEGEGGWLCLVSGRGGRVAMVMITWGEIHW